MNKKLTFLTAVLLLLINFTPPVSVMGQTTSSVTLSNGSYETDHITWTCDNVITIQQIKGSSSTAVNSSYVSAPRVYKGHILSFSAAENYKIKSISITCDGTYYGNSMTAGTVVSNNTVTDNTTDVNRTWTSTSGGTHVVSSVSEDGLSNIYIQNVASTNVQLRFTALSITYISTGGGSSAASTTVTIDASGITNTDVYVGTAAGSLSATVTNENDDEIDDATVTWSSGTTSVATINESTGEVTLVGEGSTTITASYAGVSGTYASSSATYTLTVTSSAPNYATLPFNWEGGSSSDFNALTGVTSNGLGSDYASGSSPYLIKLDGTGDYIQVKTDSRPGTVTVGVKMIGGANSSKITVQASTDGTTFDTGEELTISGSQNDVVNLTSTRSFDSNVRFVRLYFTKGANVGVGPIGISKYVEKYAITVTQPAAGGTIAADKAESEAGATITLTPTPDTHYNFTSWSVYKTGDPGTTVTVTDNQFTMPAYPVTVTATFTAMTVRTINIPASIEDNVAVDATSNQAYAGDVVTIMVNAPQDEFLTALTVTGSTSGDPITLSPEVSSATDEYTFTMPDENVSIAATFGSNYTVQFSVNGVIDGSLEETVTAGNSFTLPSSATVPTGYTFAGWTADETSTATILTGSYTPSANVTLFAVFSKTVTGPTTTAYFKVTSTDNISNGNYLIVYESGNLAFNGALETLDAVGNTISVTISDGTIASTTTNDASVFTITALTEGYSVRSAHGEYIGQTSDANGLTTSDEAITNTISFSDGNVNIVSGGAYLRYNSASNQTRFRYYKSSSYTGQQAIQLYKYETRTPSTTTYYTLIKDITSAETMSGIYGTYLVTVKDGGVLTLNGANSGNQSNLIIEDGGQLVTGIWVNATVKKNITAYTSADDGWNLISSPVNVNLGAAGIGLTTETTYDLYYLDEGNSKWINYKGTENPNFSIEPSKGYLYANAANTTLSFSGSLQPNIEAGREISLAKAGEGWNLVGNPFPFNAYVDKSYYVINGRTVEAYAGSAPVPTCTGIIVKATGADNEKVTFRRTSFAANATNNGNIQLTLAEQVVDRDGTSTGSATLDNAIVSFNEGSELGKFYFGTQNANIYIPQGNEEYAIAYSEGQGEMPVNFKAANNGTYTLTVNPEGVEMAYLHLIDNMTGTEVDLLAEPSYTFEARTTDYESRFRLVFASSASEDANGDNAPFAFISNGEIVVNGTGTLQVVDVLGRILRTQETSTANSQLSTANFKPGVYVLRIISGNDVRTQKIVVR